MTQRAKYRAWRVENGKRVQEIEFEAKSLRAAKSRATKDLIVGYGVWHEGTVFLPSGEPVAGYHKQQHGRDGALGLHPTIDMIEITSQENNR